MVLAWGAMAVITWCLFLILQPFFNALLWAAVLAIFFHDAHKRIHAKLRGRNRSALVSTLLVTLIMIVPALFVLQAVVGQAINIFGLIPTSGLLTRLHNYLEGLPQPLAKLFAGQQLERVIEEASAWARGNLAQQSARLAGNLAHFFFELAMTLFALFYFFRDGHMFTGWFSDLNLLAEARRKRLMHDVANDVRVSVTSTLVVASSQGLLGGLLFWLLGMPDPLLWGVVMGLVSLVPVLGPWLIYLPAAAWLAVDGHWVRALLMAGVGLLVVSMADNLLRPFLIAGRSPLNALWVLLSVLGGLQAFGLVGVVVGPVLVGAAQGFLRALRQDALARAAEAEEARLARMPALPVAPDPAPEAAPAPPAAEAP